MPKQTVQSSLAAKLGNKLVQAHEAVKGHETKLPTGGDLPEGIENGIAQLVECKFDVYKTGKQAGQFFFLAAGVVVSPDEITDDKGRSIKVVGKRTQIGPEPICDTPERQGRPTLQDHLDWVLNQMRLLGVDTTSIGAEDLEATAAMLKEQKPYFTFRTWKGQATAQYPNPRVNHEWGGVTTFEQTTDDGNNGGVEDNTGAVDPSMSLEDLATAADGGDSAAQEQLTKLAEKAGVPKLKVTNADNWTAVAALINGGGADKPEKKTAAAEAPKTGGTGKKAVKKAAPPPEPVEPEPEAEDLAALAATADEDLTNGTETEEGQAAATRLTELAEKAGLDPAEYESWAALVDAMSTEAEEGGLPTIAPAVTEVWKYTPMVKGPGGKQTKAKKAVECEIVSVGNGVCDLKNLDDGKTVYKAVPFGDLEQ